MDDDASSGHRNELEEHYEPFEVYTADQARRILGLTHARSVANRAHTVTQRQGIVVGWHKDTPGNATQVNLFLASWVDDVASREGKPKRPLRPHIIFLPRLAGMQYAVAVAGATPQAAPRPPAFRQGDRRSSPDPLEDISVQLDFARREAAVEREARTSEHEAREREREQRWAEQLGEKDRQIEALKRLLNASQTALAASQAAMSSMVASSIAAFGEQQNGASL
jgi:hypothetical protein